MTSVLIAAALFALARFVTKRYNEGMPSVTRAFFAFLINSGLTLTPAAETAPSQTAGASALAGILLLDFGGTTCVLYAYFTLIQRISKRLS